MGNKEPLNWNKWVEILVTGSAQENSGCHIRRMTGVKPVILCHVACHMKKTAKNRAAEYFCDKLTRFSLYNIQK